LLLRWLSLLLLFLFSGLSLLLLFLFSGLSLLLLFRLGLLLLFSGLSIFFGLLLLSVRGSKGSKKK